MPGLCPDGNLDSSSSSQLNIKCHWGEMFFPIQCKLNKN